jgi:hypothetical protein
LDWLGQNVPTQGQSGIGFRDYTDFNLAILTKQASMLVTSLNSLFARVLNAGYFKEADLLTVEILNWSFFTWHSIVHGRDLLKEGLIWHVGDSSTIKVWSDN